MKNNKKAFTLVELLAVIVILAIILVIAVPKVMSVIEDAKKATLESTAKMIASAAEKAKVQNTVLGKTEEITCESIAKINNLDYKTCTIEFEDNTAKVTIKGSGKFEELYVCDGTKTEATATTEECGASGVMLPEIGISSEHCTWEQIKAIGDAGKADEYFDLGDTKTFYIGETKVVMEMVAFNADTKADGTGTAAITWISKDLVAKHEMNSTNKNTGGWESSEMRAWLQGEFYEKLPAEVKDSIVNVSKTYYDKATSSTLSCTDSVWIPSSREMFIGFGRETSGADYSSYFTNFEKRMKECNGETNGWWLRTAGSDSLCFSRVETTVEGYGDDYARNSRGVALGFCS